MESILQEEKIINDVPQSFIGLCYKKADLHVHTPASKCFYSDYKNITPEEFVEQAINQNIEVLAITDHNSGEWIDKIKEAALNKSITIFPGVEVSVSEGFHVVGIFDTDKNTQHVTNFLMAGLGYNQEELGKSDVRKKDFKIVVNKILEYGGLPIIAHVEGKVGPFEKLKSDLINLKNVLENPDYIAVESETGLLPQLFIDKGIKRKPVCYKASDNPAIEDYKNHSHLGLGSKYTYFKLDQKITLNSLRQCFIDPDVRIKTEDIIDTDTYPYIKQIKITGGFLDDKEISFHNGLNSLIGGKGTGKSLIIEFLRFALNCHSKSNAVQEDNFSKIANQLGVGGEISVIISKAGEDYKISRKIINLNNKQKNFTNESTESNCIILSNNTDYNGDIAEIFPILAYSQNEIIHIARDNEALLFLLDTFIDESENNFKIENLKLDLESINSDFLESYQAKAELIQKQSKIIEEAEKLKLIQKQIKELTSQGFQEIKSQKEQTEKEIDAIEKAESIIKTCFIDKITSLKTTMNPPQSFSINKSTFTEKIIEEIYSKIMLDLNDLISKINRHKEVSYQKLSEEKQKLTVNFHEIYKKYQELQENSQKIQSLAISEKNAKDFIEQIKTQITLIDEKANNFELLEQKRKEKLSEYFGLKQLKYENRKSLYEEITELSNQKLSLSLEHAVINDLLIDEFDNLLQGSNIRNKKDIIANLIEKYGINELIDIIFYKKDVEPEEQALDKIENWIWDNNKIFNLLNLAHKFYPEDKPIIKYNKGTLSRPNFAKLDELSVGQRCNALLIIALLKGDFPVIIDQPEDALDITSVYEDISQNLRKNKDHRQFIITTHNNCVAVTSDSDNFICLTSNGHNGFVSVKGGIESSLDDIIKHLEGGKESYKLRNRKYLISK